MAAVAGVYAARRVWGRSFYFGASGLKSRSDWWLQKLWEIANLAEVGRFDRVSTCLILGLFFWYFLHIFELWLYLQRRPQSLCLAALIYLVNFHIWWGHFSLGISLFQAISTCFSGSGILHIHFNGRGLNLALNSTQSPFQLLQILHILLSFLANFTLLGLYNRTLYTKWFAACTALYSQATIPEVFLTLIDLHISNIFVHFFLGNFIGFVEGLEEKLGYAFLFAGIVTLF